MLWPLAPALWGCTIFVSFVVVACLSQSLMFLWWIRVLCLADVHWEAGRVSPSSVELLTQTHTCSRLAIRACWKAPVTHLLCLNSGSASFEGPGLCGLWRRVLQRPGCVTRCFTLTSWFLPLRPTTVTIYATWCRHFLSFFLLFWVRKESWDMWGHEGS